MELLKLLAAQLGKIPNSISIEGHTDSQPFSSTSGYSNWELSTDRANAARRTTQDAGLRPNQVSQVRGYADQKLRLPERPLDPSNRRISLIVQYLDSSAEPKPISPVTSNRPHRRQFSRKPCSQKRPGNLSAPSRLCMRDTGVESDEIHHRRIALTFSPRSAAGCSSHQAYYVAPPPPPPAAYAEPPLIQTAHQNGFADASRTASATVSKGTASAPPTAAVMRTLPATIRNSAVCSGSTNLPTASAYMRGYRKGYSADRLCK